MSRAGVAPRVRSRAVVAALGAALVAALAATSFAAFGAADCAGLESSSPSPVERLRRLAAAGCLGGPADTAPWVTEALAALAAARDGAPEERGGAVLAVLDAVERALGELPVSDEGAGAALDAMAQLKGSLARRLATGAAASPIEAVERWEVDLNRLSAPALRQALAPGVQEACAADPATAPCTEVYESAKTIVRALAVSKVALGVLTQADLDAYAELTAERNERWNTYFDGVRAQFPWELALNGYLYRRAATPADEGRFREPPASQWILLHPGVVLEYVGSAQDGDQLAPAIALEVVGFNRWSWRREGGTRGAIGLSAIVAYADRADTPDTRYGLMVHVKHRMSLGVTRGGGSTGWFVSADLAGLLGRVDAKRRSVFRGD